MIWHLVYCKPAKTKVQIKPHSNICPDIITEYFQGFYDAHSKFYSENYLGEEIKCLINFFAENWHTVTVSENVTKEYMSNITSI